jgi:N utilization substance protein B
MISRRNIRVKVMQTLYSIESGSLDADPAKAERSLDRLIDQAVNLFTYCVYIIVEVARYAETDSLRRSSKHRPSREDLNVNTKIAGNRLLWQIMEDKRFTERCRKEGFEGMADPGLVRELYRSLADSPQYKTYISAESRDARSEREILVHLFGHVMMASEPLLFHMEEQFSQLDDDIEMIVGMVMNFLHKPATYDFDLIVSIEKRNFSHRLLVLAIEKKEHCLDVIRPKLKNWDADRIAMLDMVIMRLGVCELLYFETIPAKVTINEYIDLAKDYSTPQSGQFVNGIIDGIHKDLEAQGLLQKTEYKK